jgi:hypothetical protein
MKNNKTYKSPSAFFILIIILTALTACNNNKKKDKMKNEDQHIIKNNNVTVLEYAIKDNRLNGTCKWYSLDGILISNGIFKDGKPYEGSFLNWSLKIQNIFKDDPYEVTIYCRDWVAFYENSFDSNLPDYDEFLEFYEKGTPLLKKQ